MPTVYNKVTINGTTYIDLSQDTVADASHIRQGYVGHLNDGTQVTGSYSGGSNIFIVTVSKNQSTGYWEPDCTFEEVSMAYSAGKTITVTCDSTTITDNSADGYFDGFVLSYKVYELESSNVVTLVHEYGFQLDENGVSRVANYVEYDTTDANATASDVLSGKTFYNSTGKVTGSITTKTASDLTASGATVTVPAGYYASQATKSVASGTEGTPTASKGSVSNHSVSVTPSVTNTTGYITGSTKTGTAVTVTASELASGNKEITANGTNIDVVGYSTVSVAVPSSASKNVQTVQSTTRRNNTALGSITSLTCSTTGTYDVYWTCSRSNTSQTWGSQLYIGGTAYETENTTWSNNVQNNYLTGVSISANQTVAVYGRSRSGYYIYAPQLTIVQTA